MFKVISLKNITCRLQEDKHLEFLPLQFFHAFLSTQPVLALYIPISERNSLPLNYFLYAYRLSSLFLVFFFSFFFCLFFSFLTLFSHNRAYRISLNLNSTQLKVSVKYCSTFLTFVSGHRVPLVNDGSPPPSPLPSLLYRIARTRPSIFRSIVRFINE